MIEHLYTNTSRAETNKQNFIELSLMTYSAGHGTMEEYFNPDELKPIKERRLPFC